MSTIFRLNGVNFNNPALPVIMPIISDGLVAAFRPANSLAQTIDLSGNNHQLTLKGSPGFTSTGVVGSASAGLITDVPETAALTIMCVSRMRLDSGNLSDFSGGLAAGFYAVDAVEGDDSKRGSAAMWIPNAGTPAGTYNLRLFGMSHGRKTSDNLQALASSGTVVAANVVPANTPNSSWEFAAVTIDTVANLRTVYIPRLGYTNVYNGNTNPVPLSFANRRLTNPAGGAPNLMHIATLPAGSNYAGTGRIEVGEALFYDRALSASEIAQQYAFSKEFFSRIRSITI